MSRTYRRNVKNHKHIVSDEDTILSLTDKCFHSCKRLMPLNGLPDRAGDDQTWQTRFINLKLLKKEQSARMRLEARMLTNIMRQFPEIWDEVIFERDIKILRQHFGIW